MYRLISSTSGWLVLKNGVTICIKPTKKEAQEILTRIKQLDKAWRM